MSLNFNPLVKAYLPKISPRNVTIITTYITGQLIIIISKEVFIISKEVLEDKIGALPLQPSDNVPLICTKIFLINYLISKNH